MQSSPLSRHSSLELESWVVRFEYVRSKILAFASMTGGEFGGIVVVPTKSSFQPRAGILGGSVWVCAL
ncbi:hypothetical protein [Vibrio comitans]|uniref:hypothetical protein n=1 Tax=Vibrio comitans TaxID=413401 RepID=UPI00142EDDA6|nr:hypothetical protein [Vibrio comitans]